MFFLLDNYDSFVYNLSSYMQELGQRVLVRRPGETTLSDIHKLNPKGIILSPGPGKPSGATLSLQIINMFKGKIPILGVCLGHQAIAHAFGAVVSKGARPVHGKISMISHNGKALFAQLPTNFNVTRYHSLVVKGDTSSFTIDARSEDGAIMSISHKEFPIYGVQYHPEAVMTECGHQLLGNFIRICEEWESRK